MKLTSLIKKCMGSAIIMTSAAAVCSLNAATIDTMMLYTDASSQTQVNQFIAEANRVYRNNDIGVQLNVVGTYRVSADVTPSGDWLSRLQGSSSVQNFRDNLNADMVALLGGSERTTGGTICGIGYIGNGDNEVSNDNYMYSISAGTCGANTFIHEVGHNMGLGHSARQGSRGGVYSYGLGYGVDSAYATIMAYPQAFNNASRVSMFSNPRRTDCLGLRCSDGQADAQRAISNVVTSIEAMK